MLPRLRTVLAAALVTFIVMVAVTGWIASRFAAAGRPPQLASDRLTPPDLSVEVESRTVRRDQERRRLTTLRTAPLSTKAGEPPPEAEPVSAAAVATIASAAPAEAAVTASVAPPQLALDAPEVPSPVVIAVAALSAPPPGIDANAFLNAEIPAAVMSAPELPSPAVEPIAAVPGVAGAPPSVSKPDAPTEAFASLPATEIPWPPRKVRRIVRPRVIVAKPAKPVVRTARPPAKRARKSARMARPAKPPPAARQRTPEEQFWSSHWFADPFAQPRAGGRSQPQ